MRVEWSGGGDRIGREGRGEKNQNAQWFLKQTGCKCSNGNRNLCTLTIHKYI